MSAAPAPGAGVPADQAFVNNLITQSTSAGPWIDVNTNYLLTSAYMVFFMHCGFAMVRLPILFSADFCDEAPAEQYSVRSDSSAESKAVASHESSQHASQHACSLCDVPNKSLEVLHMWKPHAASLTISDNCLSAFCADFHRVRARPFCQAHCGADSDRRLRLGAGILPVRIRIRLWRWH